MSRPLPIPAPLAGVLEALAKVGRPRLVGGSVRDWLLGGEPKDFDVEVLGVSFDQLQATLARFGSTDIVGRSFGVIKLRRDNVEYDFSLPRRESKTGSGHRGFAVEADPSLSDAEAAARRDFTINAIAYDPVNGQLIDPHHGAADLEKRLLRHTSPAFAEDPLRVLRAFQLAARFDFSLAPETIEICRSIVDTYGELPVERVWGEWAKWAEKSVKPSRGLQILEQTGWLKHFPEIAALRGTRQDPEWHPEGDVFDHTAYCLDALVVSPEWQVALPPVRRILSFAVLAHDFGKPSTTVFGERRGQMRWLSPGHEAAGVPLADSFLRRIGAPLDLAVQVAPLVANHLAHHQSGSSEFTDTALRRLARRLQPASIDLLCAVMRADHDGRPPLHSAEALARIERLRERAQALELQQNGPRPILLGRHLIQLGLRPGPPFKPLLEAAFEAQLDGVFSDEPGALAWLQNRLRELGLSVT
jgi:tRNA nucleotidyltransferase (CCA-adding enzyme)